jgi:hypothetical protein
MAAHPRIVNSRPHPGARQSVIAVSQPRAKCLLQRLEALLRSVFEGHEEFLGCTPD